MKLVIHMTIKHHIPQIQLFFKEINFCIGINDSTDDLKAPSTPLNSSLISVISGITTPFLFSNIDQNNYSVKKVFNLNNEKCSFIIQLFLKIQT